MPFAFVPADGLENTTSFPRRPANETLFRQDFNNLHKQMRDYVNSMEGGWIPSSDAWTYASATTITLSGNVTDRYLKGDKLRWKQAGAYKYNNIVAISYNSGSGLTTITIHSGYVSTAADSNFTNAAITDNWFSHNAAAGFPVAFNFVPVLTGGTTAGTFVYNFQLGKFRIVDSLCFVEIYIGLTSVTGAGTGTIKVTGLPVVCAGATNAALAVSRMLSLKCAGTSPLAMILSGASEVVMAGYTDNGALGTSDISTAGATATIGLTGTYTF